MSPLKHVVIVAGEESGDHHAAALVKRLKQLDPQINLSGIGGEHLKQTGVELIEDLAQYGVTGVSEVLKMALVLRKAYKNIQNHLQVTRPDLLILVDYPGFNLKFAKFIYQ